MGFPKHDNLLWFETAAKMHHFLAQEIKVGRPFIHRTTFSKAAAIIASRPASSTLLPAFTEYLVAPLVALAVSTILHVQRQSPDGVLSSQQVLQSELSFDTSFFATTEFLSAALASATEIDGKIKELVQSKAAENKNEADLDVNAFFDKWFQTMRVRVYDQFYDAAVEDDERKGAYLGYTVAESLQRFHRHGW